MNLKELKKKARNEIQEGGWIFYGVQKGFFKVNGKERLMAVLCFRKEQCVTVLETIAVQIRDRVRYYNRIGRIC